MKRFRIYFLVAVTLLFFQYSVNGQIYEQYWPIQKQAFMAKTPSECQASLKDCNKLLSILPNHPVINYLEARLNALLGNNETAFKYLKKAAILGYTSNIRWLKIHLMNDDAFDALHGEKAFQDILKVTEVSDEPVSKSKIAFIVKDKSIGTEGITYDHKEKIFYLGSDYKIIKVDTQGNVSNFTEESNPDGLGWVNGIHIDSIRRILWACSNKENIAEIFKYDLSNGKLIKKYSFPEGGKNHMFNDLVIQSNGDIYISGSALYKIDHRNDSLEQFLNKPSVSCNGITLSKDEQNIFLGTGIGICKINIQTKSFTIISHSEDFHTYGIDGLYYSKDWLYAIQNELLPQVVRFSLDEQQMHIESCEIFEKKTDDLRAPTTGVIVNDNFYFIADCHGKGSKLRGIVVMKTPIK